MFAKLFLSRRARGLALVVVLSSSAGALFGQSGSSQAAMSEDIQILTRKVNQLSLDVETMRQANADLQKQLLTQRDVAAMIKNAVNESRAEVKSDTAQANAALRKDIVDEVTRQIEALGAQINQKLAQSSRSSVSTTPPPGPLPKPSDTGVPYVVKKGETLANIAKNFNTSAAEIQSANRITDPSKLREGQTIFIPQKAPIAPPPPAPGQ